MVARMGFSNALQCDEGQPACGYCTVRKLECVYPQESKSASTSPPSENPLSWTPPPDGESDSNENAFQVAPWLTPATVTSSGQLSKIDLELLHHYKLSVWPTLSFREDEAVHALNRDWVPKMSLSRDYLLYAILSISASHSNAFRPNAQAKNLSVLYRQKALGTYSKALSNITSENYETLLITSTFMMIMVPPPEVLCDDSAWLTWLSSLLSMMQGLRVLASLKWAAGIEKLTVFPLFKRELRTLPPPPIITVPPDPRLYANTRPPGEDPVHPNPPNTYDPPLFETVPAGLDMSNLPFRPQELMSAGKVPHAPVKWRKNPSWMIPSPAFLPPPLMALLKTLVDPSETGPLDLHRPTLVPTLHALSPIFLSLYYYHLNPDLYVRIFVLPTFLTPEFFALVRSREPRALIIIGWWFAFVRLIPNMWLFEGIAPRVLQAVSNEIMRCNDKMLLDAMEGAYRIVSTYERVGREAAARSVFEGWDGVRWDEGPTKEEEWRVEEASREEQWRFEELVDLSAAG